MVADVSEHERHQSNTGQTSVMVFIPARILIIGLYPGKGAGGGAGRIK
jgi:hypothetical protein